MSISQSRLSRRSLLTYTALGVPAVGLMGALDMLNAPEAAAATRDDFVAKAQSRIGCWYVWGAAGPNTFDCSGLIYWSLRQLGITNFPRVSGDQINACTSISLSQAKATKGAIVWHKGHVGISMGDGRTLEALKSGTRVGYYPWRGSWTRGGLIKQLSGGSTPKPGPIPTIDGWWGKQTTTKLQQVLGTPADGIVSSQDVTWKSRNSALAGGWEWVSAGAARGSTVIRAMQRRIGTTADGLIGPNTIKALQRYLGTPVTGAVGGPSTCVKALQRRLQQGKF